MSKHFIAIETLERCIRRFKQVDEIFVVCHASKSTVYYVGKNHDKVIETITKGDKLEVLSDWKRNNLYYMLEGLISKTTKYRTVSTMLYVKYLFYDKMYQDFITEGKKITSGTFGKLLRIKNLREVKNLERKLKLEKIMNTI